MILVDLCYPI